MHQNLLGYSNPNTLDIDESERDFLRCIIKKNVKAMRYFLIKSSSFWVSHIKIFRRYKHAGFPILLGQNIIKNDDVLKNNFYFMSLAKTSNMLSGDECLVLPFSPDSLNSYELFISELFQVLFHCINNKLTIPILNTKHVVPHSDNIFDKILTKKERKKLDKLNTKIFVSTPSKIISISTSVSQLVEYGVWYSALDIYSKSFIDLYLQGYSLSK